jgi:allantoinase
VFLWMYFLHRALTLALWRIISLPIIRAAKQAGKSVTVETCPHYLLLASDDVAAGDTRFKCAPPLRDADNRRALVAALADGEIDIMSSDHSPAPPSLKRLEDGDFLRAWGGISGLQFGLPVTWTAMRHAGGTIEQVATWWSARPAQLVGLVRKGAIVTGAPLTLTMVTVIHHLDDQRMLICRHGC